MTGRRKVSAQIRENGPIADGIYSMWLKSDEISATAKAGQFISIYTKDSSRLLPRPISICETDPKEGTVRLVYRVSGEGTRQFSLYGENDTAEILGPLGNGYCLSELNKAAKGRALTVVGGGIGIPPMLGLVKAYRENYPEAEINAVLGYRNSDTFLDEDFKKYSKVFYASDDGSIGIRGNVIDAIRHFGIESGVICACGPKPMLKGIKKYGEETDTVSYVSLEEKMACGIGACLACVCKTKETDSHSMVNNRRVCKDGPVFKSDEIEL